MNDKQKEWIDNQPYEILLRKWRYAPVGDTMFQGDLGDYYAKVMSEKKAALDVSEQVSTSKRVGWDG